MIEYDKSIIMVEVNICMEVEIRLCMLAVLIYLF